MPEISFISIEDRKLFFEEAAAELGISFQIIEKDYWVVWTFERLFSLPELKGNLTFKGGTSLSKVFGLIELFSEDIDVSIEKDFLGLSSVQNDPDKAQSKKKQRAALEELSSACASFVQDGMLRALERSISEKLGTKEGWRLSPDSQDPQTLIFEYPNITPRGLYIQQAIKIEMGARSEHWPVSDHKIQSLVEIALKDKVAETKSIVRVLNAERTFWEKATLLNRVAKHKSVYFDSAWASYETAQKELSSSLLLFEYSTNLSKTIF